MKRANPTRNQTDLLDMFHSEDRCNISAYINANLTWNKQKLTSMHVQGLKPLQLLMPLTVIRTVGFLKRQYGSEMAYPFATARIPNFQPFLDRLTLQTYPSIKILQAEWKHISEEVGRSRMLCLVLLITQLDFYFVNLLFTNHYGLLQEMNLDELMEMLTVWNAEARAMFRSRFQTVSLPVLKDLLYAFANITVPPDMTVAMFSKWLQSKKNGVKVFKGIGPFHPMVFARELFLYDFFDNTGSLAELGKGQGSFKLLQELGVQNIASEMKEMRVAFQDCAYHCLMRYMEMNPADKALMGPILTLLDRTPTDFELENMCCEGRKMLKALMKATGIRGSK